MLTKDAIVPDNIMAPPTVSNTSTVTSRTVGSKATQLSFNNTESTSTCVGVTSQLNISTVSFCYNLENEFMYL